MSAWWLGLPPAEASVTCGEERHRLRWAQGALTTLDHDDPEAERALAALGGRRCTCVDVLDAWAGHEADPRVLALASRGFADPLAAQPEWTDQLGTGRPATTATTTPRARGIPPRQLLHRQLARRLRRGGAGRSYASVTQALSFQPRATPAAMSLRTTPESELVALLGLGGGLPDRLAATVAAGWAHRTDGLADARPSLQASMHGRLLASLKGWLSDQDLDLRLDLVDADTPPRLARRGETIEAELPFAWLAEVWSRGLAVLMGRFCLAARTEDGRSWTLTTIGPDLDAPAPMRLELPR